MKTAAKLKEAIRIPLILFLLILQCSALRADHKLYDIVNANLLRFLRQFIILQRCICCILGRPNNAPHNKLARLQIYR